MRKNCSSDREKLLKFKAESQKFANFLGTLEQFIQTDYVLLLILTCSWRFLVSNNLEQLNLEKSNSHHLNVRKKSHTVHNWVRRKTNLVCRKQTQKVRNSR